MAVATDEVRSRSNFRVVGVTTLLDRPMARAKGGRESMRRPSDRRKKVSAMPIRVCLGACLGLACLLVALPALGDGAALRQWRVAGDRPVDYQVEIDEAAGPDGSPCAVLRHRVDDPQGFVALLKRVDAEPFRGRRLRIAATVRAERVEGWAALMIRLDDGASGETVAFDNMIDRPIRGTRGWASASVVVDVPADDVRATIGVLLSGRGTVWVDDFRLEEVGPDVPSTDLFLKPSTPGAGTGAE